MAVVLLPLLVVGLAATLLIAPLYGLWWLAPAGAGADPRPARPAPLFIPDLQPAHP